MRLVRDDGFIWYGGKWRSPASITKLKAHINATRRTPHYRAKVNREQKDRYWSDEVYRERRKKELRVKYKNNKEYRDRVNLRSREYYHRNKSKLARG